MESYHQVLNPKGCICSPVIRKSVIRRIPFLQGVGESTFESLEKNLTSRSLVEAMEISPLQYQAGLFGVVATGALKVFRHVQGDNVVVFDVLTAGDFFLYTASELDGLRMYTYPDILQAMTTTCILAMDLARLLPLLTADTRLAPAFFSELADRLRQISERFIRCSAYLAEHRVAYLLQFLLSKGPKKPGYPGLIPFNLPRKDLAAMVGLTMETTSRILASFEKDGLITSGRGWVELLNFTAIDKLCQAESL
jgi:CRP/FNR family transcriptional regulator